MDMWIDTDLAGDIIEWAPDALVLLAYSSSAVPGRSLPMMFIKNRPSFEDLKLVPRIGLIVREGIIRPRDRRGIRVRYAIELAPGSTDQQPILRWTFERADSLQMVVWRANDWCCEFWIESGRGCLRLYCGERLVRTWPGTGMLAYEQAKKWKNAIAANPDRDPE